MLTLAWLGHSTVVLDLGSTRLLTDPLLRRHSGPLRRRTRAPHREDWSGTEAVLLSHLHHDHAELSSLRMLREVPVLTGDENAAWLRRRGLRGRGLADGWVPVGDDGVEVRLVPAVHHSRPMPHRPNGAHGHLVRRGGTTVWVAGDTSLYDDMAGLPALAGVERIDLVLIPIAGWGPRLSEGHLDAAQAAVACARVGARWALPVHWGTLHPPGFALPGSTWMTRPRDAFAAALPSAAPDTRLVDLAAGASTSLPL